MKIWRYVDLAKFVSMVATGTLYFPCATTELADPYEGWLRRSPHQGLYGDWHEPTRPVETNAG